MVRKTAVFGGFYVPFSVPYSTERSSVRRGRRHHETEFGTGREGKEWNGIRYGGAEFGTRRGKYGRVRYGMGSVRNGICTGGEEVSTEHSSILRNGVGKDGVSA